jgi:hypothetical protein
MMNFRRSNLFWILVCLPGLLAVQTNTLLAIHIADCCEHHCDGEGRSETPAEHQEQCPYCQFFLNIANKTLVESHTLTLHAETKAGENTVFIQPYTHQNDIACTVCRGPPCA